VTAGGAVQITPRWLAQELPPRGERAHKGTFGTVLVVGGSLEYPGAAVLAGLGALRAGAGLVRVATPDAVQNRMAPSVPELTWMTLDEEAPGLIGPGGWRRLATEAPSFDAVVIGPGLGALPTTQRRARALIDALRRPAVVDADGLNALASEPAWWRGMHASHVLTPHPGEFGRLSRGQAPDAEDDAGREAAAAEAALRWGQTVVLKGARTIVAAPDGRVLRSTIATPALATPGSGDVLAGAIGAFLAAGLESLAAAGCAVGLHAAAGLIAAERIGVAGTLAGDIARLLPEARRLLGGSAP
jgi:ADP-dependent NAD(P)H-hydrate dehydratase / NAD(P)H-hydrate epimerase